jgi:hypothetical protein
LSSASVAEKKKAAGATRRPIDKRWEKKTLLIRKVSIQFYEPVPSKASVCGLPLSESVALKVPVREPDAAGVKVTPIVQVPPLAAIDVQLLLWILKSPLFVPAIVAAFTVTAVVP